MELKSNLFDHSICGAYSVNGICALHSVFFSIFSLLNAVIHPLFFVVLRCTSLHIAMPVMQNSREQTLKINIKTETHFMSKKKQHRTPNTCIVIDLKSRQSEIIKFEFNENDCILIIEFYDFRHNFCVNTFDWERKTENFMTSEKQESSLPRQKTTKKKLNSEKSSKQKKETKIFVKLKKKGCTWFDVIKSETEKNRSQK